MRTPEALLLIVLAGGLLLACCSRGQAAEGDDAWIGKIRRDHPRLFFNADTWPAVKERALTVCQDHLAKVKEHADGPVAKGEWSIIERPAPRPGSALEVRDYGNQLMSAAFVYLIEKDPAHLARIKDMLQASLDYYHACYAQNQSVNWYAWTRMGWLSAYDWVWNDLTADERREMGASFLKHVDEVLHKPNIQRRNLGGYTTGYYGGDNLEWFTGVVFHREGFDDTKALEFLKGGYDHYQKVLAHRAQMAGDDGGAASPTVGYSFNDYPHAEWEFLYCWQSAIGEDISARWPYIAMLPNYMLWNILPGLLEFGYGDTPHKDNRLARWWPYTHMSQIMHFYGQSHPDLAGTAAYVRGKFPTYYHSVIWSVYPFLMTDLEKAPLPQDPGKLPQARYFENMGQVFMRSGDGDSDTYALFACGGITGQHRHYDALHFTLYRQGFLALDTGTREGNTDNLQNYFAQTVAHNCILIKMPGEPPSPYWNGPVYGQAGGQNKQVGSKIIAFETSPEFSYVAGDATPVYNPEKCSLMIRQFVFMPPDHFVVFDRATSTKAEYAKTWLLHHANEPVLEGQTWRSDQGEGRLFCRTLLPEEAVLEKVGGPGKEFLADGVNYSITAGPAEPIRTGGYQIGKLDYKEVPELMGRWRMEVRPGKPRTEDIFLHLIQVGDQKLERMSEAKAVTAPGRAEVTFVAGERTVTLSFATTGDVSGHIRIAKGEQVLMDRDLTTEVMGQVGLAAVE